MNRTAKVQELYRRLRVSWLIDYLNIFVELCCHVQATTLHCSQLGDNRPLSHCEFSPDDQMVAVSSW